MYNSLNKNGLIPEITKKIYFQGEICPRLQVEKNVMNSFDRFALLSFAKTFSTTSADNAISSALYMVWLNIISPIFTELSSQIAQNDQPVTHRGVDDKLHDLFRA